MKKLILFGLILISAAAGAQNKKLSELSTRSTLDGSEYTYIIYAGTSYKMLTSEFLAAMNDTADLLRSALIDTAARLQSAINDALAGTSYWDLTNIGGGPGIQHFVTPQISAGNYARVWIGETPVSISNHGLYIGGAFTAGFANNIYALSKLYLSSVNTVYVEDSSGYMVLRDAYNWVTLSDLQELRDTLTDDWDLYLAGHDVSMLDADGMGWFTSNSTDIFSITSPVKIDLDAPATTADSIYSTEIGAVELWPDTMFIERVKHFYNSSTQTEAIYKDDVYAMDIGSEDATGIGGDEHGFLGIDGVLRLEPQDTSLAIEGNIYYDGDDDILYVRTASAWDTLNGGGGGSGSGPGGTYDYSLLSEDTLQVAAYDSAAGKYVYIDIITYTLSDNLYLATLNITSSNILDGDSLQIVAAPGTGKAIVPDKFIIYYDYGTATYVSGDATNSCLVKLNSSSYQVNDDLFENTEDIFFIGTYTTDGNISNMINSSVWIDFYTHITGDGTAKIKFWYTIADFN